MEQLGAGSGTEGIKTLLELALELVGSLQVSAFGGLLGDGVDGVLKDLALSACIRGTLPSGDWMSEEEWMNTQFSVSRARPTDDASDATPCLAFRRELGHRTRRGARTPLL